MRQSGKHIIKRILIASCFAFLAGSWVSGADGQKVLKEEASQDWSKISGLFSPPAAFQNEFGDFKSPLRFYNGDTVANTEDWLLRREEILGRWHQMMGPWPDLLKEQQLEFLDSVKTEGITRYQVAFNWLPGERTQGYLLVPEGSMKKAAVITVFYEPETAVGIGGKPYRDFAIQLAKRGFITLSLGTTEATANRTFSLYYPNLNRASVQPLSMLAYAAANAWQVLAKVPEVDSSRIGIVGHSFGGKWAMFASCLYEKFACAAWSDPGIVFDETREAVNYWEPWYLGYHPQPWRKRGMITADNPARGLYPKLVEEGYDLTDLHALMAPRPFLVSGGSEDPPERWKALNHSILINKRLGYTNRVAMSNRPEHSPNEESNEQIYAFFSHFLKGKKR
ncbi:acyl-CoA thioester hydrolase/BAAT C-terminal domain-containing protein [Sunxiuqinia elliptica]|uniref:Dienelactone hydrolase n=1 Tax=Sunxiuqinia elliptica TaxID=655355 RepID=A0A1I2JUG9_9BACT|nr:acyl-CoA thioester hydrolase/BAAT C-terminal domain-containing protein [Sunxiuqinia elliptica]SFF56456.1 Dienelactone hydrolase [Sunxiuqinia elliptica]